MSEALSIQKGEERFGLMTEDTMRRMKEQADLVWKSGLVPKKFQNPEQIIITASYGRMLGLGFQQSLISINVIEGVPGLDAKTQLAFVRERCPKAKIRFVEQSLTRCVIEAQRPEDEKPTVIEYTYAEVPDTLRGKANWKNHVRDMLTARCITRMTRMMFSDILAGFGYDPQELMDARELRAEAPQPERRAVETGMPKRGAVKQEGTVVDAEVIDAPAVEDVPSVQVDGEKPVPEAKQELAVNEETVLALVAALEMMKDENQVSLAYDKFRAANQDDAGTLMEGYSVMQKRIAALKVEKK